MTPFLRQIAETYVANERDSLMDFCFVFPNKRSASFFRHHLIDIAGSGSSPLGLPRITTLGELTAGIVPLTPASRIEQLFTLFNEYRKLQADEPDFDRFMFWGEMILSDFNDVDLYLVDPDRLFVNLKRYREITANFLTEEQRAILSRYWGENYAPHSPEHFWQHLHYDSPSDTEQRFLRLWEVLAPLYHAFTSRLESTGMATSGMIARRAVRTLHDIPTSRLSHTRYIFVGFNVLTLCEISIMENLQARGVADFYWDTASPALADKANAAGRFVMRNSRRFPSRYDLSALYPSATDAPAFPSITLTGIPSATGQVKMAGHRLSQWIDSKIIPDPSDALDTAVVLPDDSLLIPMLHSVPASFTRLNVTMGLPMRTTSFASLVSAIVSMHLRATLRGGEWCYFYDDVRNVVSHPLLSAVAPEGCLSLRNLFAAKRIYFLPASLARDTSPELSLLFASLPADSESCGDNAVESVYQYFLRLLEWLGSLLAPRSPQPDGDDDDDDSPAPAPRTAAEVESFFIDAYIDALHTLRRAIASQHIDMSDATFLQLLQKSVFSTSVSFTGEPLSGLQIMGVLETRALDFDNIILLSMNEQIFPRKHYKRSFIPDSLRHSYGMATTEHQESIYAYYFYRLIARARNVAIFYDSRTGGTSSGEMSRYVTQLLYLFPQAEIRHTSGTYLLNPSRPLALTVSRTPEIMEKLLRYCTPGGPSLSASVINTYLGCSLQFYLKYICGLDTDNETPDYMDSATYGTILHAVAQKVYNQWKGSAAEVKITAEMLDSVIDNNSTLLDRLITETVNEEFNRRPAGDLTPLTGEARVMGNLIRYFLQRMFQAEKQFAPFDFIEAEKEIRTTLHLAPGLDVNVLQFIDRIDRIYAPGCYGDPERSTTRIIDYKTGGDRTDFNNLDDLFNPSLKDRRKALLQLMFYCLVYSGDHNYDGPLQPLIYKMRTIFTEGISPVRKGREPFLDWRGLREEFISRFTALVREILLSDTPFTQTPHEDHCSFCQFRPLCHR